MKKAVLVLLVILAVIIGGGVFGFFAAEKYTSRPEFCGTQCHIMKPNHETWKKDKHSKKDIVCVDCHYAPGEKPTPKAKFRALGQLFSYLATKDKEVRKRAVVNDLSCTTSDCHPKGNSLQKDKENFLTKKIDYKKAYQTDYKGVIKPFIHKTHEEKTIEGQKLRCSSCHTHQSAGKHFEVPKESCFLCHFRKAKDNDGRAKCSICHEIPTKSLQKQKVGKEKEDEEEGVEKKPITHQTLEKAKVPCYTCHFELISGKVELKKDSCIECHHDPTPELMKKIEDKKEDKKLMHDAHVTKQTARCFNCHEPIQHKKADYLAAPIPNCAACHQEPHLYVKMLTAGEERKGVDKTPAAMHDVKTGCFGCHTEQGYSSTGQKIAIGSPKACVACHTKDHEKMVKKWVKEVKEELQIAKGLEKDALEAIEKVKGKIPEKKLKDAMAMLKEGQANLWLVEAGGGVHNKKYTIKLLDAAEKTFENLIDDLKNSD
ncbi:MAG: NapC/NirT family cytochrome c [Nitrospirae bacterium]|nr:NapC/NirT family cytochrome c [Nitrospirota bacterium]MBI5203814.1 NapC/NirT family cytochrome c [Nitrospirota bacterium]